MDNLVWEFADVAQRATFLSCMSATVHSPSDAYFRVSESHEAYPGFS